MVTLRATRWGSLRVYLLMVTHSDSLRGCRSAFPPMGSLRVSPKVIRSVFLPKVTPMGSLRVSRLEYPQTAIHLESLHLAILMVFPPMGWRLAILMACLLMATRWDSLMATRWVSPPMGWPILTR